MAKGAARILFLPASATPIVAVMRRKPSAWWHCLKWDTRTDAVVQGGWHRWIYEPGEASPDGSFMTGSFGYFYGAGVLKVPSLEWVGRFGYGTSQPGVFVQERVWDVARKKIRVPNSELIVVPDRQDPARQGWIPIAGDWYQQPSPDHPRLWRGQPSWAESLRVRGAFRIDGVPEHIMRTVTDACYDVLGQLLVAREGWIERYTLDDLKRHVPSFRLDLNNLRVPAEPTVEPLPEFSAEW